MANTATSWPAEAIWESVAPLLPGFTVEVLPQLDSSNAELMRRARAGRLEPVLLVLEHQTAGRGRLGRQWHSADGARRSLTFSLGLPLAPQDWSGLSLAVGLSVAQSLHPEIRLKWPNDLWWRDRKLAGILIETASWIGQAPHAGRSRYVVVGIGINIQAPPATDLATPPAGLDELLPGVDAAQALARIALPLVQMLLRFEQQGFAPLRAQFNARDALDRVAVTLSDGQHGVACGVDAMGALQLETPQGLRRVTSAEVSVRPASGPAQMGA